MNRGQFLTDRRLAKGLSQSYIAEELGYSPQTISQWENDKGLPELSVISKYASILGIDLAGFILCKNQRLNSRSDVLNFDIAKFAANLKFIRKKNNLLQSDVAKKLLVNTKTVGSWEKGLSTPTLSNFVGLCSYLKLSYDELYFAYVTNETIKQKPIHKKRIFLPIILPIFISVSAAGTTTAVGINQYRKNSANYHTHVAGTPVKENVVEATCTENGSYDLVTYCISDNKEMSREHIVIEALGHNYIKVHETICDYEHDGVITYSCTRCGDTYEEVTGEKLVHTYSTSWNHDTSNHWHDCLDEGYETLRSNVGEHKYEITVVDPTYESAGSTTYTCSICGYSYSEPIAKLEHKYSTEWDHDEESHWHSCLDTGYETLISDLAKHTFSSTTINPTYDEKGETTYTCSVCGYSYSEELPKKGHTYSTSWNYDASNHWHDCLDEGYESLKSDLASHTFSSVTINPTYEENGSTTYTCSICGYSYTEELPKKVHTYSDTYSYDDKYHYHQCLDEGFEELYIDKEEHDLTMSTVGTTTTITCSKCDYEKVFENELAIIDAYDENEDGILTIGAFEDIYITILNVNDVAVSSISVTETSVDTLETHKFKLFTASGGLAEVIDSTHLRIKKEHFEGQSYLNSEKDITLQFTKINDIDLPSNLFTFSIKN